MSDEVIIRNRAELKIPALGMLPEITLDISNIKESESRLIEARVVNGATYCDLEYSFNEGYREAKKHLSTIGYQIAMTDKLIRKLKSQYLIDDYPAFMEDKGFKDSAALRDAFLETKEDYVQANDRMALLNAMESLMDGKIKVFENVCRFMRKEIDILVKSGFLNNKYTT